MNLLATEAASEEARRFLSDEHEETKSEMARLLALIAHAAQNDPRKILSLVASGRYGDLYSAEAGHMRALLTLDANAPNEMLLVKIYDSSDEALGVAEALARIKES